MTTIHQIAIGIVFLVLLYKFLSPKNSKKHSVNGNDIDTGLESHYLMLLGLDRQYGINQDIINDAYQNKVKLLFLSEAEGEEKYLNELRAAQEFLLDACEIRGAFN
jgi:hypothetical protein